MPPPLRHRTLRLRLVHQGSKQPHRDTKPVSTETETETETEMVPAMGTGPRLRLLGQPHLELLLQDLPLHHPNDPTTNTLIALLMLFLLL
jgi:hypothetical protein